MNNDSYAGSSSSATLNADVYVIDNGPETSTTPWFWGGAGAAKKTTRNGMVTVELNSRQRTFIYNTLAYNTDFSNAVQLFLARTLKNGLKVTVTIMGKTLEFSRENDETRDYFVNVIKPNVEKLLLELMLYGVARVRIIDTDSRYGGLPKFTIMPENTTVEYMWWDDDDQRHYGMEYSSSSSRHKIGTPVPNGHLLVMNPPRDDGWLTSRAARGLTPLAFSNSLWHSYIRASSGASHPPYIFTPEGGQNTAALERDTTVAITSAMGEIIGTEEAQRRHSRMATGVELDKGRQALSHAAKAGANRVQMTITHQYDKYAAGNTGDPLCGVENAIKDAETSAPWKNQFTSAPGHKLQSGPRPYGPEQFIPVLNELTFKVYRALGVPPGLLSDSSNAQHAANVEMIDQELLENVQKFQTDAAALLHKLFSDMFGATIDRTIFTQAEAESKDTDATYLRDAKRTSKVEVRFLDNPTVNLDVLSKLYDRALISKEVEQKFALGSLGIPMEDALKDPEEEQYKRVQRSNKAEASGKPETASSSEKRKSAGSDAKGGDQKRKKKNSSNFQ